MVSEERATRGQERPTELEAAGALSAPDSTERWQAEQALRESEERYRQLVEHAPTGIYEIDLTNARLIAVNDAMCDYTGYTREEFLALNPLDLLTEDSQRRFFERYAKLSAGEQVPETVEYQIRVKNGRELWVLLNARFFYSEDNQVTATVVAHNITERKRAEQDLHRSIAELENFQRITNALLSLEKLSQVINTIAQGIVTHLGYDFVLVSRYVEEEKAFRGLALHPIPQPKQFDRLLQLIGRMDLREAPTRYRLPYQRGENPIIDRVLEGEMVLDDSLADFFHPWVSRTASTAAQRLFGLKSFIDVPMQVKGKTVGTILAGVRQGPITSDQQEALSRVASQAAVAMENARLYEAEGRRSSELARSNAFITALGQVAARLETTSDVDQVLQTLGAELRRLEIAYFLALFEPDGQHLVGRYTSIDPTTVAKAERVAGLAIPDFRFSRDLGPVGQALTSGQPVLVPDLISATATLLPRLPEPVVRRAIQMAGVPRDMRAVYLPLRIENRELGILAVWGPNLRQEDVPALSVFANQVAVALESARLYEQAQREVVERKRAEEALRESRGLLHSLIESLPQSIYSKDLEGRFIFANRHFCATQGKPADEILGRTDHELHPPELAKKYIDDDRWVIETRQMFETIEEHQPMDRESIFVHVIKTPLYDSGGEVTGTLGIFWDVTERRRAEQLLGALNQAALAMAQALTPEEIFAAVADEFRKLGLSCMVLPTDQEQSRLFTRYASFDSSLLRTAEKLVGLERESFSFPTDSVDFYRDVVRERKSLFAESQEHVVRQVLPGPAKRLGGRLLSILGVTKSIAAPLVVEDQVIGVLSVHSDDLTEADVPAITAFAHQMAAAWHKAQLMQDLKKSLQELQQTQSQLIQAQKMEAVGRLAGGVAHDFNNLLTVIRVSAQLLMRQLHSEDPLWEHVRQIQDAGERATRLTSQLLSFSRREVVEPRTINLSRLVGNLSRMLQRIIGEDIDMVTALERDLWSVRADPSQMEQVIINLVVNARDAMPRGGRLSIETANVVLDEASIGERLDFQTGEHVLLTVWDTGVGMDQEVRSRVFEPFFTTKERGEGLGLGLPTVYGIVKQNGGHIWLDSEPDRGTTFQIYLPRVEEVEELDEVPPPSLPTPALRGSETILVVEDEAAVRELAVQILKAHGYQVLAALNGPEALETSEEHKGPIDLLLTDVVMPELNGRELAERLGRQRPNLRVLYISGYSDDVIAHHGVLEEGIVLLPKPFTLEDLTEKVRAVLDAPA